MNRLPFIDITRILLYFGSMILMGITLEERDQHHRQADHHLEDQFETLKHARHVMALAAGENLYQCYNNHQLSLSCTFR